MSAPKKLPQTEAIFETLHDLNRRADRSRRVQRMSLDAKASVKVGLYSRGGRSWVRVQAADHDFKPDAKLTPFGILMPREQELYLYFTLSKVTSDFMVDMVELWWASVQGRFEEVRTLVINQDNGPENGSRRTQFIKRMVAFARRERLRVRLAYNTAYHSKYNPIERCWGVLEQHWSGGLLDSVPAILRFAESMTWCGKHPLVELITKSYCNGVRLKPREMNELERQLKRLPGLEKWFVSIPYS